MIKFLLALLVATPVFGAQLSPPSNPESQPALNLLANPGFEARRAGWTNTGGTFSIVTGGSAISGKANATFTPSAGSQTLQTALYTVTEGLKGNSCVASLRYKTSEATNLYTLKVLDGSANVLGSVQIPSPVSQVASVAVPFLCPTSGTIQLQVVSSGSASALSLDDAVLGENRTLSISQARSVGSVNITGSALQTVASGTYTTFSNAAYATRTNSGLAVNPTSANDLAVKFPSLQAGTYLVSFTGEHYIDGNASASCEYSITDGTTRRGTTTLTTSGGGGLAMHNGVSVIQGEYQYSTAQTNVTFSLQAKQTLSSPNCNAASQGNYQILVYFFPSSADQAYLVHTINWYAEGEFTGGDIVVGNSIAALSTIASNTIAITATPASQSVLLACPTGTTPGNCSGVGVSREIGFAYNQPAPGDVEACADVPLVGTSMNSTSAFQLVFTSASSSSSSSCGESDCVVHGSVGVSESNASGVQSMTRYCGRFHHSSAGQKVLRLEYTNASSTGSLSIELSSQPHVKISVKPQTQMIPAPVFAGSITTPSSSVKKIVSGWFAGASSSSACGASPCVLYGNANEGVSSVTRTGTGVYVVNFAAGTFSAAPVCTCNTEAHFGTNLSCQPDMIGTTASSAQLNSLAAGPTLSDGALVFTCIGPK
jgi:hypothetical protein